jgi:hypothetical protein
MRQAITICTLATLLSGAVQADGTPVLKDVKPEALAREIIRALKGTYNPGTKCTTYELPKSKKEYAVGDKNGVMAYIKVDRIKLVDCGKKGPSRGDEITVDISYRIGKDGEQTKAYFLDRLTGKGAEELMVTGCSPAWNFCDLRRYGNSKEHGYAGVHKTSRALASDVVRRHGQHRKQHR